jgi:hypothetical protein
VRYFYATMALAHLLLGVGLAAMATVEWAFGLASLACFLSALGCYQDWREEVRWERVVREAGDFLDEEEEE